MSCEKVKIYVGSGVFFLMLTILGMAIFSSQGDEEHTRDRVREVYSEKASETGEGISLFGLHADIRNSGEVLVSVKVEFVVKGEVITWGVPLAIPTGHRVYKGADPVSGRSILDNESSSKTKLRTFTVNQVLLDGKDMPYELIEGSSVVTRIYPKSRPKELSKGKHVLEVQYKLEGAVEVSNDGVVLDFPIVSSHLLSPVKRVSASFSLPKDIQMDWVRAEGFLGSRKDPVKGVLNKLDLPRSSINFWTSRPLAPLEGMFITVKWPAPF